MHNKRIHFYSNKVLNKKMFLYSIKLVLITIKNRFKHYWHEITEITEI